MCAWSCWSQRCLQLQEDELEEKSSLAGLASARGCEFIAQSLICCWASDSSCSLKKPSTREKAGTSSWSKIL